MISVTCSNCKTVLEIDDAFAGGVCRCQHCGTIQTVPSKSMKATASPSPKVLHQATRGTNGTGLDELANVVASSGLSRSGLSGPRNQVPVAREKSDRRNLTPILLIAGGALIVLLGIILVVVLMRGGSSNSSRATGTGGGSGDVAQGPTFCQIPLTGNSVIFLLDRGNSITELFDTLKANTYRALEQLGPDRKFQVILWDNTETGSAEYPANGMKNATAGEIDNCRKDFQDLVASGQTHVAGSMREALERHPEQIIIATEKSELDEDDVAALRSAIGKGVRVDVVQIGGSDATNPVLQEVAKATGGHYQAVSASELRSFAQ